MISRAIASAAGLVLAANAFVLATVALDRAGDAEFLVELTEREIPVGWSGRENTGVELTLHWMMDTTQWLDESKARELSGGVLMRRGSGRSARLPRRRRTGRPDRSLD